MYVNQNQLKYKILWGLRAPMEVAWASYFNKWSQEKGLLVKREAASAPFIFIAHALVTVPRTRSIRVITNVDR